MQNSKQHKLSSITERWRQDIRKLADPNCLWWATGALLVGALFFGYVFPWLLDFFIK
jgi:hypothetical protein